MTTTVNLLDVLTAGRKLPKGCTHWGIKSVRPDLRTRNDYQWPFPGQWAECNPERIDRDNRDACPLRAGDSLCVALTWYGMASAGIPARTLLLVAYSDKDRLSDNADPNKLRAFRVRVVDLIDGERLVREHGTRANLSGADLRGADLARANLSGADLTSADLYGANLSDANLRGADLTSADLYGANLSDANLRGANLRSAYLSSTDLYGANLRGANLSCVNLSGADLSGADLSCANLSGGTHLIGANLNGANLSGADLTSADLYGANLSDANLNAANLSGALGLQEVSA